MGLINYSNKREINNIEKQETLINQFFKKISFELEYLGAKVNIKDNTIFFSNKDHFTTHTGENMQNMFKIVREGKIFVIKDGTTTKVYYESNLTQHSFLSAIFSIIMSLLIGSYSNFNLQIIIKVFLLIFVPLLLIGFIITKIKMDGIIKDCINSINK